MRKLECMRCSAPMHFLMREKFQKGDMGVWVGNLNFSMQGGFEMEVYSCPKCGKLEFYLPDVPAEEPEVPEMNEEEPLDESMEIVCVNHEGTLRCGVLYAVLCMISIIPNALSAATEHKKDRL